MERLSDILEGIYDRIDGLTTDDDNTEITLRKAQSLLDDARNSARRHERKTAILHLSAYDVARCYGGPAEGGWWYDSPIFCHTVKTGTLEELKAERRRIYEEIPETDTRYRSTGGCDRVYFIESRPRDNELAQRPHYE